MAPGVTPAAPSTPNYEPEGIRTLCIEGIRPMPPHGDFEPFGA
jgi:hypothetical protein